MKTLFGEEGYALAINASIPDWFYEGDAVYNETFLTKQGRGRFPLFLNAFPSLWQAGYHYSWMKLRNGSLKDYVPTHYYLGYLLVNYGSQNMALISGRRLRRKRVPIKDYFIHFKKRLNNMPVSIIKPSGGRRLIFIREVPTASAMFHCRMIGSRKQLTVNKKYVTSYFFPYSIGNDSLVYLKSSNRHLACILYPKWERGAQDKHEGYFHRPSIQLSQWERSFMLPISLIHAGHGGIIP